MAISPLSLTAGAGLYQNQGILVNAEFTTNRTTYESTSLIGNLLYSIGAAVGLGVSDSTLANMISIGSDVSGNYFPALGDSLPSNLVANIGNSGLVSNIANTANIYTNNTSRFAQIFAAAQGYVSLTNDIIESAINANNYLGPTYNGMDDLISGDLAKVNLAYEAFGQDLQQLGELIDFANYGTPASVLQQISRAGNMLNGTTPALQDCLLEDGLTQTDIASLVNNNVQDLFNPDGLTQVEFDSLQKRAYPCFTEIQGADLQDILDILGVTTPGIESLADLLNPLKIFPTSWPSLTMSIPQGPILIYNPDATVNSAITSALDTTTLIPQACDQLAKIIPPDQAAANQALAISFSQIKNIGSLILPQVARAVE